MLSSMAQVFKDHYVIALIFFNVVALVVFFILIFCMFVRNDLWKKCQDCLRFPENVYVEIGEQESILGQEDSREPLISVVTPKSKNPSPKPFIQNVSEKIASLEDCVQNKQEEFHKPSNDAGKDQPQILNFVTEQNPQTNVQEVFSDNETFEVSPKISEPDQVENLMQIPHNVKIDRIGSGESSASRPRSMDASFEHSQRLTSDKKYPSSKSLEIQSFPRHSVSDYESQKSPTQQFESDQSPFFKHLENDGERHQSLLLQTPGSEKKTPEALVKGLGTPEKSPKYIESLKDIVKDLLKRSPLRSSSDSDRTLSESDKTSKPFTAEPSGSAFEDKNKITISGFEQHPHGKSSAEAFDLGSTSESPSIESKEKGLDKPAGYISQSPGILYKSDTESPHHSGNGLESQNKSISEREGIVKKQTGGVGKTPVKVIPKSVESPRNPAMSYGSSIEILTSGSSSGSADSQIDSLNKKMGFYSFEKADGVSVKSDGAEKPKVGTVQEKSVMVPSFKDSASLDTHSNDLTSSSESTSSRDTMVSAQSH